MSIGEPPFGSTFLDEAAIPEPVRVSILHALDRIREADESYAQGTVSDPVGVVAAVDYAFRRSEIVEAARWSSVFRSYFVESVAALAITRDASDQSPLTEENVDELLRNALRVLEPLCAPA